MAVKTLPPSGKIVVGQIHADGISGSCSVVLELEYEKGGVIEARTRDASCNTVSLNVGYKIGLGDRFSYVVTMARDVMIVTVTWADGKTTKTTGSYNLKMPLDHPVYFKAGVYVQDSGSTGSGEVELFKLATMHPNSN
jgi:hypothetical protein